MSELAANAFSVYDWVDGLARTRPLLLSDQFPDLPNELSQNKPLELAAHITFTNLRIAAHTAYEIAFLADGHQGEPLKTPLIVSRTSVEASANAHHLGSQLTEHDDEAFLTEALRERIWMARQAGKVTPGGQSEHLDPALRYAESSGLFARNVRGDGRVETDAKFAARIERGRNMSDRIQALFPEAPNNGFHYGWLSGFAHVNPSTYFQDYEGNEVVLGFGSAMTALTEAANTVCTAFQLPFERQRFNFWFET